jgi:hypothetical protein
MKEEVNIAALNAQRLLDLKDAVDRLVTESLGVQPDLLRAAEKIGDDYEAGMIEAYPWEEVRERILRRE